MPSRPALDDRERALYSASVSGWRCFCEQHRLMAPALAPQRMEVGRAIVAGNHCFAVYQE
jgi:hypothetical protein